MAAKVLQGAHSAGERKRELGMKELLKRNGGTERPTRQAREGGTTGRPRGLEPGGGPAPSPSAGEQPPARTTYLTPRSQHSGACA